MMDSSTHDEPGACEPLKDLKLAASFVKSIETGDHRMNLDIQRLAREIEDLVKRFDRPEERT